MSPSPLILGAAIDSFPESIANASSVPSPCTTCSSNLLGELVENKLAQREVVQGEVAERISLY